ncbi:MAG: hypothetical protein EOO73_16310 [Myxococcales bacterium]|nr:MAG: hypothetical protein EOO73_16310 [Myxococcales bacterium]
MSPRPVAWAAQSPRPAACLGAPGLWEASRQALVARRCRDLARAQALLLKAPARAKDLASGLLAEAPELTEARIVRGRARLRLGDSKGALADLAPLLEVGATGVADPAALWDGGRAALAQKDALGAARFYRALGSRAALLPDRSQQVVAYIEIASALLATDSAAVDDVLAYLREARRRSSGSGLSGLCAALSAVAWLGEGRDSEAQGALGDLADPTGLARFRDGKAVALPDGVLDAALAVALERSQPELSAQHYRALAQSPLGKGKLAKLAARQAGAKRGGR